MSPVRGWEKLSENDTFTVVSYSYKAWYVFISWVIPGVVAIVRDPSDGSTHTIMLSTTHLQGHELNRLGPRTIVFQAARAVIRLDDIELELSDAEGVERAMARL